VRQLQIPDVGVLQTVLIHLVEECKDLGHSLVVAAKAMDFDSDVKLGLELFHRGLADWCPTVQCGSITGSEVLESIPGRVAHSHQVMVLFDVGTQVQLPLYIEFEGVCEAEELFDLVDDTLALVLREATIVGRLVLLALIMLATHVVPPMRCELLRASLVTTKLFGRAFAGCVVHDTALGSTWLLECASEL